jgi:colicin import membrane protein
VQTKTRTEPRSRISLVLAIGIHLAFIGVLFFAINWKTKPPAPIVAELWTPPPPAKPQPAPKPVPRLAPPPKVVPPPEPKVEVKPPEKVDIALEQEKERKRLEEMERKRLEALEQKRRKEEEARRQAEVEKQRKEEAARKRAEAEQKRKAEEARAKVEREKKERADSIAADKRLVADLERETRERMARELDKTAPQTARREGVSASASGDPNAIAGYVDKIRGKIQGNVILPTTLAGNPEAEFLVQQLPTGEILSAKITRSSGNKSLDAAWERAILKSSPLPIPERREIFQSTLRLKFRPSDKR